MTGRKGKGEQRLTAAARMRLALRSSARRLSTLATVVEKGAAVSVHLKTDGFAELPITLPIHRRGETALEPRPGAPMIEVRFARWTERASRDWTPNPGPACP